MSAKQCPVVHFEMPAEDTKRMAAFYAKAFGWKHQQMGDDMGNYVVVSTTESDQYGRPTKPGAINGGLYTKSKDKKDEHPSLVIGVDDINASIKSVKEAGGTVLGEPMMIPNVGSYVSFIDTEGNRCSMLQPSMS